MKEKSILWLLAFLFISASSSAGQVLDPKIFASQANFSFNEKTLVTKSAFVVLTDELFSGRVMALEILFSTEAVTEQRKNDILNNNGRVVREKDHAILVLFLDKENKISQVNLTFVIPGQTVVRTVAWKPEELNRFSSNYFYDGKRLKFQNKGDYKDPNSEKVPINLTWDVNVDIPVFEKFVFKKK